jgi:hypothetical protein
MCMTSLVCFQNENEAKRQKLLRQDVRTSVASGAHSRGCVWSPTQGKLDYTNTAAFSSVTEVSVYAFVHLQMTLNVAKTQFGFFLLVVAIFHTELFNSSRIVHVISQEVSIFRTHLQALKSGKAQQ